MVSPRSAANLQQTLPSCRPLWPCHGLISCLYSSCDQDHAAAAASSSRDTKTTKEILYDRIVDFYEDAFNRLPWEDMPELVQLMSTGGLCVGLLDPVSNIILNTVSLLPPGFQLQEAGCPSKSTRLPINKNTFYDIASRSYLALIGFLLDYFGCLTEEQAGRYLRWSDADLALAVLLVEYDLYSAEPERLPDPGSGRTQASLELAVRRAGHPAPDRLVQLTASVFHPQRLEAVKPLLLAGGTNKLTVDDLYLLQCLVQDSGATSNVHVTLLPHGGFVTRILKQAVAEGAVADETSDLGDGYKTTTVKPVGDYISSLRSREDMAHEKLLCLTKVHDLKSRLKDDSGESCEHLQSLKMRIRDTVHSLYLDAIALLPCQGANWLIRDILVAGHCYGPLKPVANIIVNSIWHNRLRPLPVADCSPQYDILDTLSMLRTEVRSLEGIMEAARAMAPGETTSSIMRELCLTKCDISQLLWRHGYPHQHDRADPLLRAAVAAQHPLSAALALFHKHLAEDTAKMGNLHSVFNNTRVLSVGDIDRMAELVDQILKTTPHVQPSLQPQVPQMHKDAYSVMLRKRSEYECQIKYFRSKVAQMLDKYAAQHPWEGKYTLRIICGVEKCGYLFTQGYRLNFMAGNTHDKNTLFFAEFWVSHKPDESKPDICCPLNPPYSTGRCFYSKNSARKIVYPDTAEYFMCDVTAHGISNVDDIIDVDFVYFDSQRDVEFVKKLNSYYAENSFWRPTVLDTDTQQKFACISFKEIYPCSSVAELGIGLSLGELV